MPQYVVLKTSSNATPPVGEIGTADMYLGDHADLQTAMGAAATKWKLGPGVFMWGDLASNFVRHVTSVTTTQG